MLKGHTQIRLTRREVERFTRITGFEPLEVRTLGDLADYVATCKKYYWGVSEETRFLHWLIDETVRSCFALPHPVQRGRRD
jgi:hypothetical protein